MAKILICTQCGHVGKPVYATKGSFGIEMLLWLFFLVPGLIYSIWRLSSKTNVCEQCKSPSLIPVTSPNAKSIFESTGQNQAEYLDTAKSLDAINAKRAKTRKIVILVLIAVFIGNIVIMSAILS
ncbi:MAG TPA: hypothetical protein VFQ72_01060 [Candidatus Paceibacterota bacterium]|nr:hypothetical protein [Candidatus Paceibacterota bacterium]